MIKKSIFMTSILSYLYLASLVACAHAEPRIQEEIKRYTIHGSTASLLRSQMDKLGPCAGKGIMCDAWTSWDVRWNYKYGEEIDSCSISSVNVNLNVVIQMPEWGR